MNDNNIRSIGKLLDFATPEEVEKYYGSKIVSNKSENVDSVPESNFIL
jgi:hypothetical protein